MNYIVHLIVLNLLLNLSLFFIYLLILYIFKESKIFDHFYQLIGTNIEITICVTWNKSYRAKYLTIKACIKLLA